MNVINILLTLKTTIFNFLYNIYKNIYYKFTDKELYIKSNNYSTTHFESSKNLNELKNKDTFTKIIKKLSFNNDSKPISIQQNIIYDKNDYIGYNICYTCNKQIITLYGNEYRYKDNDICKKCYTNILHHISNY